MLRTIEIIERVSGELRRLDAELLPALFVCDISFQAELKNGKPIPTHCISQRESV